MAIYFDTKDRLIIPRWREFNLASVSAEHFPSRVRTSKQGLSINPFFNVKVLEWNAGPTVETAWELVNSAFILNDYESARQAALFLKANLGDMSPILRKIIADLLGEPIEPVAAPSPARDTTVGRLSGIVGEKIGLLRMRLSRQPRNEFYWIELGRLYSITGQLKKAKNCFIVALQLSNGMNRYLLRAASRFYYHMGDYEHAQQIIKGSPYLATDPWLLSAEIAYAVKQKRFSKNIKRGMDMVGSGKYSDASLTELAGTLGTLELLNSGSKKLVKKLTAQSLRAPNDNSLAQAEWISRHLNDISIEPWLDSVELAHEAKAYESFYAGRFNQAATEGMEWFIDQPFSKRATHFISYLYTVVTPDFDRAIDVCRFGLKSNPGHFPIINNLAFAYASAGRFKEAKIQLNNLNATIENDRGRIIWHATEAFLDYKQKNFTEGMKKYQLAIQLAKEKKIVDLQTLAESYFTRERYLAGELSFELASSQLKDLVGKEGNPDILIQLASIVQSMKRPPNG